MQKYFSDLQEIKTDNKYKVALSEKKSLFPNFFQLFILAIRQSKIKTEDIWAHVTNIFSILFKGNFMMHRNTFIRVPIKKQELQVPLSTDSYSALITKGQWFSTSPASKNSVVVVSRNRATPSGELSGDLQKSEKKTRRFEVRERGRRNSRDKRMRRAEKRRTGTTTAGKRKGVTPTDSRASMLS